MLDRKDHKSDAPAKSTAAANTASLFHNKTKTKVTRYVLVQEYLGNRLKRDAHKWFNETDLPLIADKDLTSSPMFNTEGDAIAYIEKHYRGNSCPKTAVVRIELDADTLATSKFSLGQIYSIVFQVSPDHQRSNIEIVNPTFGNKVTIESIRLHFEAQIKAIIKDDTSSIQGSIHLLRTRLAELSASQLENAVNIAFGCFIQEQLYLSFHPDHVDRIPRQNLRRAILNVLDIYNIKFAQNDIDNNTFIADYKKYSNSKNAVSSTTVTTAATVDAPRKSACIIA